MVPASLKVKVAAAAGESGGQIKSNSCPLVLFLASLLPAALARQRLFHALFFTGFQIKGVPLDLLDNVFLLHLALKTPQCILEGLTLLQSDFRQRNYTPKPAQCGLYEFYKVYGLSQETISTPVSIRTEFVVERMS
jgi:hypothetical protein